MNGENYQSKIRNLKKYNNHPIRKSLIQNCEYLNKKFSYKSSDKESAFVFLRKINFSNIPVHLRKHNRNRKVKEKNK